MLYCSATQVRSYVFTFGCVFIRTILTKVVGEDLNYDQIVRVCKDTGRSCVFNKDSLKNTLFFVHKICYIAVQLRCVATFSPLDL